MPETGIHLHNYNLAWSYQTLWDFPVGLVDEECRRHKKLRFDPWIRKIPWRRAWQPILVFLPEEPHEQRRVVGYSPQGHKESDTIGATECACTHWILLEMKQDKTGSLTGLSSLSPEKEGKIWNVWISLIGWWWGNRVVLQESYAWPEVTILHLGVGTSSVNKLKDIIYTPWGGTRTPPEGCVTIWLFLFLHPLPYLTSNCLILFFGT